MINPFTGYPDTIIKTLTEKDKDNLLKDKTWVQELRSLLNIPSGGGNSGGGGAGSDTTAWHQGGDAFGALGVIGTTDTYAFRVISDNVPAVEFSSIAGSAAVKMMPTDRTITTLQAANEASNTLTIDYASAIAPVGYWFHPTVIFNQNANAFVSGNLFYANPLVQNSSGSTRTIGPFSSFVAQNTLQANGGSLTASKQIDFNSNDTFNRINSGTVAVTQHVGYQAQGVTVGAGATVTAHYGFLATDSVVTGTLTNNYGIKVDALSNGTNNYGAVIDAASTNTLWLASASNPTTAAGGVTFGSSKDTKLYRSAASTLKTDGKLVVGTPATYSASNVTTDRTYDANATSLDELADIVGTLIADLRTIGLVL